MKLRSVRTTILAAMFSLLSPLAGLAAEANSTAVKQDSVLSDACCAQAVESCNCACTRDWVWFAGTDATFLHARTNNSGGDATAFGRAGVLATSTNQGGYDAFTFAPRTWIGFQGECWGIVGRFFYLSDSSRNFDPLNGGLFGATGFNRVKAYTTDLELQRRFVYNESTLYGTFGVRYASLESDGTTALSTFNGPDVISTASYSNNFFHGTGLTSALYGRTPVRACSNLNWFYGVRGSVLFGTSQSAASTSASVLSPGGSAVAANNAVAGDANTMYIGEAQLGLQWDHQLTCLPATAYFRVVGEYQHWGADSGNVAASSLAVSGGSAALATANSGNTSLDLVGFSIGTGFMW